MHVVAGGRRWGSKEVAEKEVCREIGGGGGVNDPDSRDRTCVSPRTTDYE